MLLLAAAQSTSSGAATCVRHPNMLKPCTTEGRAGEFDGCRATAILQQQATSATPMLLPAATTAAQLPIALRVSCKHQHKAKKTAAADVSLISVAQGGAVQREHPAWPGPATTSSMAKRTLEGVSCDVSATQHTWVPIFMTHFELADQSSAHCHTQPKSCHSISLRQPCCMTLSTLFTDSMMTCSQSAPFNTLTHQLWIIKVALGPAMGVELSLHQH
jgi:hypothetical protein